MRTFYRIETLNMDEGGIPECGYMATVNTLLALRLGIKPDYTAEELQKALTDSKDDGVKTIWNCLVLLGDIPIPDIYKKNQQSMFCLYTREEYEEAAGILNMIWDEMAETIPWYSFRYKTFKLKDEEILYEDPYQVVITKDVYEKHKYDSKYRVLGQ